MYVEQDRDRLECKERKSYIEHTDRENLQNTIKQMNNRLDKEQTAWATVMTEKYERGSRHLKKAGFSLIAWDRGSNHAVFQGRKKRESKRPTGGNGAARTDGQMDKGERQEDDYLSFFLQERHYAGHKHRTWQQMKKSQKSSTPPLGPP